MSRSRRIPRNRVSSQSEPQTNDKATYLLTHGWATVKSNRTKPWEWYDPAYPGALYTLEHAYDVARSTKNQ